MSEAAPEPTDEQLENVAQALGFPVMPEALRPPYYREAMLNLHRLVQRSLDGDQEASKRIEALRGAFAR